MPLFKSKKDSGSTGVGTPAANRNSYNGAVPPPAYEETDDIPVANGKPPLDQPPQAEPPPLVNAPPVDITAGFANLRLASHPKDADVDTCLAHLKLLAAFQNMKEEVGYTDGLWNIWDTRADTANFVVDPEAPPADASVTEQLVEDPSQRTAEDKMAVLSRLREKRWAIFVARAVDRYQAWWTSLYQPSLTEVNMTTPHEASYEAFPTTGDILAWTPAMLPPLGAPPVPVVAKSERGS